MNIHRLLTGGTLSLCLLFGEMAWGISGPQVAQLLNTRYADDTARCVGDTDPTHCSGAMVRRSQTSPGRPFWMLSPQAIGAGYELFAYVRKDIPRGVGLLQNGYVLTEAFTAIGLGKVLDVLQPDLSGEVRVKNWNEQAPGALPVQALYYERNWAPSLLAAQRDQLDYFQRTGEWLPVLRLDLTDPAQQVFGFNQQDQLYYGYQVASRLNARFRDTSPTCRDGSQPLNCNGVMIRGVAASPQFHAWDASPNSITRNGVSWSWARADVGMTQIAGLQGLILSEGAAPSSFKPVLRCLYPFNAGTSGIPNSCRRYCDSIGVTTVATYNSLGSTCSLNITAPQVQLSNDVRNRNPAWNELIIAVWPLNMASHLPLEALFFVSGSTGLKDARFIQRDFYQQTSRTLPIMRVNLAASTPFVYDPTDQNTQ